ncbi:MULTISPECIES: preprotein translocase subunit SecA [Achromobacter]|uniref:Protein translocase subunit SecA n=1 Tax=Alcaligenes xylosoxydans xylosoxydans TaxID=85698 RepID=A0A424WE12_ALCXX|nr:MULTISPECIES: preprotein translocase subunit SecA [Achromobacter]MBC9906181.1 preprotein translocase subunit SecA [Achromobacter xylosoxidans]MBD0869849.1 preprotein translocase subunit SecA [Achromobacter xylosoxidans]QNP85170.1 preprotein translocase subunit SecA [Achromobacter xylosoxidans]RPJ91471.1 preprotein translocase subunit SecA [Achromobacter xylosoxidans]WLW61109.1 preprotein translocase subunit SecA [Achromobacter aegrifaciens]
MVSLLKKLIGSRNDRLLKQYRKLVTQINGLEPKISALSDAELAAKTEEFRSRHAQGTSLDDLLPEAFAVVREAGKRVFGMRHFDVQMLGGIALHSGKIAEMRTGEGKTLMATLPVYLNAIAGKGVHVVTVNDYLARRDAEWMGRLYHFLGLSTGVVVPQQPNEEKKAAYQADITYGTNNEFGFDYLRDNMEYRVEDRRQRGLFYAIVDEVDSILIDEARTPLIISGQAEDHTELYVRMNAVPPLLKRMAHEPKPQEPEPEGDYWVDEKSQQVYLSEAGHENAEGILSRLGILPEGESLYDPRHIALMHHLMVALRANTLFFRDQQYVVQDGEVVIVDEFTGRLMVGRRWSDGLHQAVEAKEGVKIQHENQTLASITFQNYFRMYEKLSGMTGTADTEAYEFQEIYGLETVIIPTNKPMVRKDQNDQVFKTDGEKYNAILEDIRDCHERGQPVLVGTTSIENSELLSGLLKKAKLPHEVLNAKQHAREAEIVAEAGKPGHITIATNMAGRGTDIVLGGSVDKQVDLIRADESLSDAEKSARIEKVRAEWKPLNEQVKAAGGLRIIGTERHESRRIDNQLRGRAGRQGDPGSSRFYLSLEDSLMRIFAGDRVRAIMERLKLPEGEPIEAGMVTRSIETAQRKVEGRNFDIRKQLLEYDDVANDQRKVLYSQRNDVLEAASVGATVQNLRDAAVTEMFNTYVPPESVEEQWDVPALQTALEADWHVQLPLTEMLEKEANLTDDDLRERVVGAAREAYQAKVDQVGTESWSQFERSIMLQAIDTHWREHLSALDYLRQGIHLRGYAQKNPKQEYKREAFELFSGMLDRIRDDVVRVLMTVRVQSQEQVEQAEAEAAQPHVQNVQYHHSDYDEALAQSESDSGAQPVRNALPKVGRNDPCPCGSGKKYKQCHGKLV